MKKSPPDNHHGISPSRRRAQAWSSLFVGPCALPEFPCRWSWTTVAWSVPAFLPRKPSVGAPLLSAMVALGPPDLP